MNFIFKEEKMIILIIIGVLIAILLVIILFILIRDLLIPFSSNLVALESTKVHVWMHAKLFWAIYGLNGKKALLYKIKIIFKCSIEWRMAKTKKNTKINSFIRFRLSLFEWKGLSLKYYDRLYRKSGFSGPLNDDSESWWPDVTQRYSKKSEILPQFRTRRSSIPDTIVSAVTQGGVKNGSFMIFREDDIESYTNRQGIKDELGLLVFVWFVDWTWFAWSRRIYGSVLGSLLINTISSYYSRIILVPHQILIQH